MSLSNSQVLRRYTPPTCTLEIVAPRSPLSRWAGRTVATQLQFHLHLDDPRLPEQRIHLTGDREQLEALQQAVTTYVQELLNQSPAQFTAQLTPTNTATDSTTVADSQIVISPANSPDSSPSGLQQIFLKPSTGLSHTLSLGSLATPVTGPIVQLSVLQLFDLATALDEYEADIVALPSLNRRSRVSTTPPAWATIAAGLTLAVGLFAVLQQLNRPAQQQITSNQIPEDPQQVAVQPSPLPPLSSIDTLPPPPPVGSPVPVPATPLPAIPVPNAVPPTPTVPGATAPQPGSQQQASPPTGSSNAPTIAVPSPLAQLNTPNPRSQATIQAQPTAPAQSASPAPAPPQQQAANNTTTAAVRSPSASPAPSEPAPLDNISQVGEARQFFQRRWEPTAAVKQTLEYSLLLDVDGTIQRIEPLNQAARDQIDRTGMPLIGEPFVSPISDGKVARIRVVLTPDGKVQTFLEDREAPQVTRDPRENAQ
ncbi:DUF4335 domain-containing protein [Gloeocapsopsis sp. IPPAS B-1203]|uniref:DUF4335 domain-containing protein n=1 Tax=Gloeocapsopsis sp. IPPAS B-1203 TaxID=2049454 RepID=UPI000C196F9F|nr:DUF4335 domain-containing protein [Gloeocapsopsis sp. IPPAS B-1203]PIG95179.1 hypothetical protein CSQ79_01545 [Gloeocapsopsis sp. IPPAS B-1203]